MLNRSLQNRGLRRRPLIFVALCCAVALGGVCVDRAIAADDRSPQTASSAVSTATSDAAAMSSTPAARQFSAWLSAFNSDKPQNYRDFINANSPNLVKFIDDDLSFAALTGGFSVVQQEIGDATSLTGLLSEPFSDQLTAFTVKVESEAPHRILAVDLGPAARPGSMAIARLPEPALAEALRQRLDAMAEQQRFSGVVLVAKGDRLLFEGAYGMADVAKARRNRLDTRFGIASMGKMFTATAIMQLVAAGKLDLQAPLGSYLPDYPDRGIAKSVTLHHLLTHTGGTGDIFVPEVQAARARMHAPADFIDLLGKRRAEFAAGAKWSYSNYGFILLGRVIERASGEGYFDYVRRYVFAPAGMQQTGRPALSRVSAAANGYVRGRDGRSWSLAADALPAHASPAGGALSTARDLHAFARALQTGKLLSVADVETMTRGSVDMPGGKYAYGFKDQMRDGLRYIGHGGGAPGANDELDIYPGSGYIVVVLTNQDPPMGNRIADFIGNRLPVVP